MAKTEENLQNGLRQIEVNGVTFPIGQKVIHADQAVSKFGVTTKELPGVNQAVMVAASHVFSQLEVRSREDHVQVPVSALWYEFPDQRPDVVCVRVPMLLDGTGQTSNVDVMLQMRAGDGRKFVTALQDPAITRPAMATEILAPLLASDSTHPVDHHNIWVHGLATFSEPVNAAAGQTLRRETSKTKWYADHKGKMKIQEITWQSDWEYEMLNDPANEVDLSEFVRKSIFFRSSDTPIPDDN